jgi:hypothetical protein
MEHDLKSVLVLIHPRRRHRLNDSTLRRLADSLPNNVAEKIVSKIESEAIYARGAVAMIVMPRQVIKPEPLGLVDQETLLLRAGMKWIEKRDLAMKGRVVRRRTACRPRRATPCPITLAP